MTNTDNNSEFEISRTIVGDIEGTHKAEYEQWSAEIFLSIIDGVLAIDGVEAIKWTQYTPYFNDGDALEFGIQDLQVKISGWPEDGGEDGFYDLWELKYVAEQDGLTIPEGLTDALKLWDTQHLEKVALKNFGDHAQVTATPEGFEVEYYEHD